MEPIIKIENVRKIYKVGNEKILALDGVDLTINKGEFCCLLGTSGSGKSTLLNVMAGIEKLTSGEIIIRNRCINKMTETQLSIFRQKYLGFIFQAYNLVPSLTAFENIELPLIFKEVPKKERIKRVKELVKAVGLEKRYKHKPSEMSGGQQQRVGIARAFATLPEIIFADEPTGNLDSKTTMEVMELIRTMAKEYNQTIVMVTHDTRIAEFADKVVHIHDGKITEITTKN
ncbi:MAG: ABC transporter ATP-binding protein [Clostridia bacterium]|nr:ABC transporter ATP-binding protein [Clostridia bacterium]